MAQARKKPVGKKPSKSSPPQPVSSLWDRYPGLWLAGGLFLLTLFLYGPTVGYEYTFDDDVYTRKNKLTQKGLSGLGEVFGKGSVYGFNNENSGSYRPLTLFTFALEHSLHGSFQATTSHLWNLLLHALALALLGLVLLRWLPEFPKWLLFAIGLLYLLHPVHVEVGANVKSRDEILALLGVLAATLMMLTYLQTKRNLHLGIAILAYFLGCLAKENAIIWIAFLPLLLWQQQVEKKEWIRILGGLGGAALAYFLLRWAVLDPASSNPPTDPFINNSLLAASGLGQRTASHAYLLGYYLKLLVWPHPLRIDYSYQQIPLLSWGHIAAWISLLSYLGLIGLSIWGLRARRLWALGIAWLLLFLLPVSHLVIPIGATLAERFLFLPSLGFCIALGVGLYALQEQYLSKAPKWSLPALMGVFILLAGWQTRQQIPVWQDNDTLFRYGVETSPRSFRAHLNLAEITRDRAEKSQNPQARQQDFQTAVSHYVSSLQLYNGEANTWYNLGVCYSGLGRADQAHQSYLSALKLAPGHARANNNVGVYYFQRSDYPTAQTYFEAALQTQANYIDALANLGACHHNMGQAQEALGYYQQALEINPQHRPVLKNIGQLYRQLGDEAQAAEYLRRAGP